MDSTSLVNQLLNGLHRLNIIYPDLPLVPLNNNKQPLGDGWQNRPYTPSELIEALASGGVQITIAGKPKQIMPQGFGILTGRPIKITVPPGEDFEESEKTYYLLAIDQDGLSAADKILELSSGEGLPKTVAFTSGRVGRCQFLFLVPEQYIEAIHTKKIRTGVKGEDGKDELLEFRWKNLQSVLPPSVHPTTGQYHWVEGCAIDEVEIAIAPIWVLETMLIDTNTNTIPELELKEEGNRGEEGNRQEVISPPCPINLSPFPSNPNTHTYTPWTDEDWAKSYLDALCSSRADNYEDWVNIGMALHSVSDSLLSDWESFSASSGKYKPGECQKKWRSFSNGGGITLGTLAHMAIQDGWQSPFGTKNKISTTMLNHNNPQKHLSQKNIHKNFVTGDNSTSSDNSKSSLLSVSETVTRVTEILKKGLSDYEEQQQLDELLLTSTMTKAAFWQLVKNLTCSLDEVHQQDVFKINQLINWNRTSLDWNRLLPEPLATAFNHDGKVLNIDPVCLWQYLLPVVLSISGKRIKLDIQSHYIPPIIWCCLVGDSGIGKTRAEGVILSPLRERQHEEHLRYQKDVKEYKELKQKQKEGEGNLEPPQPERKWLFETSTIQAVMKRLSEQGQSGSCWIRDEIAGLFKSLGQFSPKGESEGLELLLKLWDGSGAIVDRVKADEDSYNILETRLNIAGGIQPGAFRKAFKDPDDAQGVQARFLYAIPEVQKPERVKGYCQLSEILPDLYSWLDRIDIGVVKLSLSADERYTELYRLIGEEANATIHPAVRAWMRKLPTQLLRIALGLHLIECYFAPGRNQQVLQLDTLERAVAFCCYYRNAFELVQEKVGNSDNISSILFKILDLAQFSSDGITARDAYRGVKAIARCAEASGRKVGTYTHFLFSKLVEMGKGVIKKDGRMVKFFATFNPPNGFGDTTSPPNPPSPPNPHSPTSSGFWGNSGNIYQMQIKEAVRSVNGYSGSNFSVLAESVKEGILEANQSDNLQVVSHTSVLAESVKEGILEANQSVFIPHQSPYPLHQSPLHPAPLVPVTEVTEAQTYTASSFQVSSNNQLSPVTETTSQLNSEIKQVNNLDIPPERIAYEGSLEALGFKPIQAIKQLVSGMVVYFNEGFNMGKYYLRKAIVDKLESEYITLTDGSLVLDTQVNRMLFMMSD